MGEKAPFRRFRFRIRDLGFATVIVALTLGWLLDHRRQVDKIEQISTLVQPASTIEGRVTYLDSGKPAAGVRILAQPTNNPVRVLSSSGRTTFGVATTDDDGHYRFVDLAPANWNVFVETDGWTANAIDALPVVAGQEVKNADLQLVKGGFIRGRVVDETGKPVSRAQGQRICIGVYGPARPKSGPAIEAVYVNAEGQFQIRVPPGKNYPYIASVMPQSVLEGIEFGEVGITVVDGNTAEVGFRIESSSNARARPVWPPVRPKESDLLNE